MAGNDKKKKPQTPGGGKPRKDTAPSKGSAAPATTGGQMSTYANDPESGMQPLVPAPGYTDHRPKSYKGGSAQTFVNGHGLDMSQTENRNFVSEVNRHERAMFRRRANAEQEEFDRASRQAKEQRYREAQARRNQERLDRNFERGAFSTREGWENLGRSEGRDKDGKAVSYGRGASGVEGYDSRYEGLMRKADKLSKLFEVNDLTGRGDEWAAIRKLAESTHAKGGLTAKQLDALEAKMQGLVDEHNDRVDYSNAQNAYRQKRSIAQRRKEIGDIANLLSDEQVDAAYNKRRWRNIKSAIAAYNDASPMTNLSADESGVVKRSGARIEALQTLLDNGMSAEKLARIAIQSGQGNWAKLYDDILSARGSEEQRLSAIEDLGVAFLQVQLGRGEKGQKALMDVISPNSAVSKAPVIKRFSWDAPLEEPAQTSLAEPIQGSPVKLLTPVQAEREAEDRVLAGKGATTRTIQRHGPTVERAADDVQSAGAIADAETREGLAPQPLSPKVKGWMKLVPGPHQSDGSVGELTPFRFHGAPDILANVSEATGLHLTTPLTPRKTSPQVSPEHLVPGLLSSETSEPAAAGAGAPARQVPHLYGGSTGEHAMQTVETGFDKAADALARKVKNWFK